MELLKELKQVAWEFVHGYGLTIFKALAIFVLGILIITAVKKTVKKNALKSRNIDNAAAAFITSLVALVAYVCLVLLLVGTLGFSTTGIIAAFSSVMLAISLGLQNTLSSLTNGIVLIFTKPFSAGDYVDIGGTAGTVKEVKLFSVKLVTGDNVTVILPNNTVLSSVITNYSRMPMRRVDMVLPMPYEVDIEKLKELIHGLIEADERIKKDPAPFFRLTEYGASSLDFTLRVWTDAGEYWNVRLDLMEKILYTLRENGIEMPYDQLQVHVVNADKEVQS
ncbi:MAG: mechanosensitive ion channel [Clostridia bacterium]|nr:mechanosensitive ion channel [Clostridia bacterium]